MMTQPPESRSSRSGFDVATLIATWFMVGRSPKAPGTMGSLAALPFAWGLLLWGGTSALALGCIGIFALGWWASAAYVRRTGRDDPGEVVVDEVAGQWIALLVVPPDLLWFGAAFILFRLFDIWKPWPISWLDREIKGGLGIMADDVLAGVCAAAVLLAARHLIGG